jgi:hypothetical protein
VAALLILIEAVLIIFRAHQISHMRIESAIHRQVIGGRVPQVTCTPPPTLRGPSIDHKSRIVGSWVSVTFADEVVGPRRGRLLQLLREQRRLERQCVVAGLRLDHRDVHWETAGEEGPTRRRTKLVDVKAREAQALAVTQLREVGSEPGDIGVVDRWAQTALSMARQYQHD